METRCLYNASCIIVSLITYSMLQYERTTINDHYQNIDLENAKQFQLVSNSEQELDGQVFFNEQTNELYIYVDGLHSLTKEEQYHAWITIADQTYLLGHMQWLDGRGLIYSSDHSFDFIAPMVITVKKSPSSNMWDNDMIIMQLSN